MATWTAEHPRGSGQAPPDSSDPRGSGLKSEEARPSLEAGSYERISEAVRRASAGEVAGRQDLFSLLLSYQGRLMSWLRFFRLVPWDVIYDAVIDMMIGIVEEAMEGKLRLPAKARWLWRWLYRRAARQLWEHRRAAKDTREKRRDKKARTGNLANLYLPRIMFGLWEHLKSVPARSDQGNLDAAELLRHLREVLAKKLTRRERTLLFARLEGLRYCEIASMVRTSPGAARVLHHKVIHKAREAMAAA